MTALLIVAASLFAPADVVSGVTDSAITTSIKSEIGLNPHVNTFGIHITTNEGVVTLSGRVEDETQKALAEQIAHDTKGVSSVVNNLTIIPTTITEKQERAFKQRASDKAVATSVRARMVGSKEGKGLKIGVDVVDGVVTLHGVVNTDEQKDHLAQVAANTKGVASVVNNLVVRKREKHGFVGSIGVGMGDEWLESKIEFAIVATKKMSIREIDVEVDDGVCYLSGVVENEEQKKVAGDIAAGYTGIKEVNNAITVREGGVTLDEPKKEPGRKPDPNAETNPKHVIGSKQLDPPKKSRDKSEAAEGTESKEQPAASNDSQDNSTLQESEPTDEPNPKVEERTLEPPK